MRAIVNAFGTGVTGTTVRNAAAQAKKGMEDLLPIYGIGDKGVDAAAVSLCDAYEVIKVLLEARDGAVPADLMAILHYDASASHRMVVSVEFRRMGDPSFNCNPCAAVAIAVCKLSDANERQALDVVAVTLNAEIAQLRALGVSCFASGDYGGVWKYASLHACTCLTLACQGRGRQDVRVCVLQAHAGWPRYAWEAT